jgi:hypothetical protein
MTSLTNHRVEKSVDQKLVVIKKWINITKRKKVVKTYSDVLNYIADEFIRRNEIEIKENITRIDIDRNNKMIKDNSSEKFRIDNSFKPSLKNDLKALSKLLFDSKITQSELNYNGIVKLLLESYFEKYPELKNRVLQDEFIHQKIVLEKIRKRRLGYE